MSKSFESTNLLSFLSKCLQAFLRNACPTAIAVYTRIVMRQPPTPRYALLLAIVRITGLEPARDSPLEPKSSASANSAISASKHNYSKPTTIVSMLFTQSPKIV